MQTPAQRITQPTSMRTTKYSYGVVEVNGNSAWQLFCAAADGDIQRTDQLLDHEPELVNAQFWYQMPIHLAVLEGHADVVARLLERGANPAESRWSYRNWDWLLAEASRRNFPDVHDVLVKTMKDRFNYSSEFSQLFELIDNGDINQIRKCLDRNRELVHYGDPLGNRPIHWAALLGDCSIIDLLLEAGCDINARRADGQTPIQLAITRISWTKWTGPASVSKWTTAGFLRAKGADLDIGIAAAMGDQRLVEQMLATEPALANRLDRSGRSPLMYAARSGQLEIVQRLLDHGADPNQTEFNMDLAGAALHSACGENNLEVSELLLKHGADPNAEMDSSADCKGIARHHYKDHSEQLLKLLDQYGATKASWEIEPAELIAEFRNDPQVVRANAWKRAGFYLQAVLDQCDQGLLDEFACAVGDELFERCVIPDVTPRTADAIALFLSRGQDINRPDWMGNNMLHRFAESGNQEIAQIYLDHGSNIDAVNIEDSTTPLGKAVIAGQAAMVDFFLASGSDTHVPVNRPWAQPLELALEHDRTEIAERIRNSQRTDM